MCLLKALHFVSLGKIIDGSPAGCCESLHVGDHILAINRVNISTMPHQEIVSLIKASGLSIVLTISPVNGRTHFPISVLKKQL